MNQTEIILIKQILTLIDLQRKYGIPLANLTTAWSLEMHIWNCGILCIREASLMPWWWEAPRGNPMASMVLTHVLICFSYATCLRYPI